MLRRDGLSLAAIGAALGAAMLTGPLLSPAQAGETIKWSGAYIGAHAGHGWADWDGTILTTAGCGTPPGTEICPTAGYDDSTHTLSGSGWLGGGQIGFNWQSGAWVLGLEADVSGGDLNASGQFATDQYNPSVWDKSFDLSIDTFGTVRGRLGLGHGNVMPYVTAGLAWAQTSGELAVAYSNAGGYVGTSYASTDETHVGWTAGAGVEWRLAKALSLKAEYLYADLGSADYLFKGKVFNGEPFETDSFAADLTLHTVRVGVNYQFSH